MAKTITLQELRKYIRKIVAESVNNFEKKEEETNTKQLKNNSSPKKVGDPMDVKMNQQPSKQGSDEKSAPTVSVKAGSAKAGAGHNAGQHQAKFSGKTERAKK